MTNNRANVRSYNGHVLMGNWYEDRIMEEEVLKDFLRKRYTGQLATQQKTEVERMSESIPLSVSGGDGLLRFGHQIILVNTWTHAQKFTGEKSQLSCCVATGIEYAEAADDGASAVTATGTTMVKPTQRSALVIRRPNHSVDSQPVRYGDEILLTDINGQLFLTCVKSNSRSSRTCDVILTNKPGRNSVWIVMHPSINLRMEFEGSEVKIDDKIILAHASTNKCLSVNEEHSNRSPYGLEYELLCELSTGHNLSYKQPILWKFQTQSAY